LILIVLDGTSLNLIWGILSLFLQMACQIKPFEIIATSYFEILKTGQ